MSSPPAPRPAMSLLGHDITPYVQLTRVQKYGGVLLIFWPFVIINIHSGAGCIWNDILDRDFDRQVERTKSRPLASGVVKVQGALIFLSVHLILLVAMLYPLNKFARKIGLLTIFFFPGLYPLMKRVTYWPQAWLGFAMNMGIPLTWAAISGACPRSASVFFAGAWAWSIWYDTIYACQDKKDDVNVGIKSTAVLFDQYTRQILALFGATILGCFAMAGYLSHLHWAYYAVTIVGALAHLTWQLKTVDLDSPKSCWKMFAANAYSFGSVVYSGLLVEYLCSAYAL
ncbi:prenyltransferase [Coprinopsis sp. MPI-PUGE-AT-0042]|nr:prenyltransferase [Coprinopsis sp. MPI-PUGE-AT-0042]